MKKTYENFIGKMKTKIVYPISELSLYIGKYVFYENHYICNDRVFKAFSNGRVEMFIHLNNSYIDIIDRKKKYV